MQSFDMEDVKNVLKPVEWSTTVRKVNVENSKYPLIAKPTLLTSKIYEIPEEPVLLHHVWVTQRIVAQNLEDEGTYVVGPQIDIPAEYTGTFTYRCDQKGNDEVVQIFNTVKDIAVSLPEIVFPLEKIVTYPVTSDSSSNQDKIRSVILQPRERLTVLEKLDVQTVTATNRIFGGKSKFKHVLVPCVAFRIDLIGEIINLPLTVRGKFSTKSFIPVHGRELDFNDVLTSIDLSINLTTCRNCPRSPLDEHVLRPSTRLRMTNIEEHEVLLGVTTTSRIIEFSLGNVEFILPKTLDGSEDNGQEIAYQTALQRFLMECQIKNSPINVRDYKKSVRNHVSRTMKLTNPRPLSQTASTRAYRYITKPPPPNGVSAIQLLVNSGGMGHSSLRRTSFDMSRHRHALPLPLPPEAKADPSPPLPPRNGGLSSSLRQSPRRGKERAKSYAGESFNNFPMRPPPQPPTTSAPAPSAMIDHLDSQSAVSKEEIWESLDNYCLERLRKNREDTGANSTMTSQIVELQSSPTSISYHNVELLGSAAQGAKTEQKETDSLLISFEDGASFGSPSYSCGDDLTGAALPVQGEKEIPSFSLTGTQEPRERDLDSPTFPADFPTQNKSISPPKDEAEDPNSQQYYLPMSPLSRRANPSQLVRVDSVSSGTSDTTSGGSEIIRSSPESPQQHITSSSSDISPDLRSLMQENKNGDFRITQYSVISDDSFSQRISLACNYVSSPVNWKPPDDLRSMTVSDVGNSLRYIGMNEDTVDWFHAEKVDGELLCSVDHQMLTEHFRLTPFQNRKLTMFLEGWRPKE